MQALDAVLARACACVPPSALRPLRELRRQRDALWDFLAAADMAADGLHVRVRFVAKHVIALAEELQRCARAALLAGPREYLTRRPGRTLGAANDGSSGARGVGAVAC
jgi:hypothetical protein